jgi:hypothetical protein
LFFAQVEYCDNLIFRRRAALDQLGERLLDANRTIGQPNKITVIFGRRTTPDIEESCRPSSRIWIYPIRSSAVTNSSSASTPPLTAGLLQPFSPDNKLQHQRLSHLDNLYQRVVQALDDLVHAIGLKAA